MKRTRFVAGSVAALVYPWAAAATGGLDPDVTPPPTPATMTHPGAPIRVLLGGRSDVGQAGAQTFAYAGKTYRGSASVVGDTVIASVPIDAYLYGVLPLEAGHGWPAQALAVQAIVARTYALARRAIGRTYDVVARESDQLWGDVLVESADCTSAVDSTAGQTLRYGGGIASVFYSACCGGHTADAAAQWGRADLPYLRGVSDPYCLAAAPDAQWTVSLSAGEFGRALAPKLGDIGPIRSVALRDAQDDGRRSLVVSGSNRTVEIAAADARRLLGTRTLRGSVLRAISASGDLAQATTTIVIEGSGRGHGVGLCQWGARVLARQGRTAREILAYYFPGTVISNV